MTSLMSRLSKKAQKGSKPRCHWLTHGTDEEVAERLTNLIAPWGTVASSDSWMPEGFSNIEEAQLHNAPALIDTIRGKKLQDWWLTVSTERSKTPNFDIASTCTIKGKPGLILVEAKAHTKELKNEETGKNMRSPVTANSRRNHVRIDWCIKDANLALSADTGFPWALSRDWNYQMSNRFTWSWKLTEMGFPVILVYLAFLNAREMKQDNSQLPFAEHSEWAELVKSHSESLFPQAVWRNEWVLNHQRFIPLIRSMDIPVDAPCSQKQGQLIYK